MNDPKLETLELNIAKFLRYGVLFSGALIFVGWMSQISFERNVYAEFHDYQNVPLFEELRFLFLQGNWGLLLAYAGLIALISLPFIRVLLTATVFITEKDYILAGCAALVLAGLVLSFALGAQI